jgi:hypothetical protein
VMAMNLVLPRPNIETSYSVRIGPSGGYERYRRW